MSLQSEDTDNSIDSKLVGNDSIPCRPYSTIVNGLLHPIYIPPVSPYCSILACPENIQVFRHASNSCNSGIRCCAVWAGNCEWSTPPSIYIPPVSPYCSVHTYPENVQMFRHASNRINSWSGNIYSFQRNLLHVLMLIFSYGG